MHRKYVSYIMLNGLSVQSVNALREKDNLVKLGSSDFWYDAFNDELVR